MATTYDNILFVAVARASDKLIVASVPFPAQRQIDLGPVRQALASIGEMPEKQLHAFNLHNNAWHLMQNGGIIFVFSTSTSYPDRVSSQGLNELDRMFVSKVGDKWKNATRENALTEQTRTMLQRLCEKYDNVHEFDKVSATLAKVQRVQVQMQQNIQVALENCVALEKIESDAAELQASAGIFKQQAHDLKRKMWWKNLKMKLLIACIVLVIIGIIVIVALAESGAFSDDD